MTQRDLWDKVSRGAERVVLDLLPNFKCVRSTMEDDAALTGDTSFLFFFFFFN